MLIIWVTYAATVSSGQTLTADLFNEKTVPSWAVMSFNLSSCPNGWSEYLPAQWRFIRWIDKTWTNIDPDWERIIWSLQSDIANSIDQIWYANTTSSNIITIPDDGSWSARTCQAWRTWACAWAQYKKKWTETRPKNVALLYCEKI